MTTDPIDAARAMIEPLTGYTPWPWKAWQPRHDESVPVRTDGLGITIAYVHQGAVTSAHNNARLIAAAPGLRDMVATLADALEVERAKVAAAYAASDDVLREHLFHKEHWARRDIRALTPTDAQAALDKLLAEARADGIREAALELEINWGHKATPEMRDAIRALPEPKEVSRD